LSASETRELHCRVSSAVPDFTEFIIGPAEGRTRWLHPGYKSVSNKWLLHRVKNPYLRNGHLAAHASPVGSLSVLNRFDPYSSSTGEAEVKYLDGDFRVMRPGAFVRCAVTGTPIPLEELKYWSVERQEAYANPRAVLERLFPARAG
jgi:hypothetical protein